MCFFTSTLLSEATRFKRQMATGSSSTLPLRQAGSHGLSHVRPKAPGKTFESQSFDHGYPPVEIEKVVNKMLSFVK